MNQINQQMQDLNEESSQKSDDDRKTIEEAMRKTLQTFTPRGPQIEDLEKDETLNQKEHNTSFDERQMSQNLKVPMDTTQQFTKINTTNETNGSVHRMPPKFLNEIRNLHKQ